MKSVIFAILFRTVSPTEAEPTALLEFNACLQAAEVLQEMEDAEGTGARWFCQTLGETSEEL